MNNLLVFFALPVATIILAIVLEKQIHCPFQVAAIFFAIFLVVAFAAFDASFLIYVVAYTIIAYVAAVITRLICNFIEDTLGESDENNNNDNHHNKNCCCRRPTVVEGTNQGRCNCANEIRRVEDAVAGLSDNVCQINCLLEDVLAASQNNNSGYVCRRRR